MSRNLPAISLVAVPGRRRRTIELAQEIERRGFAGIYSPSMFGNMSFCEALAWNTGVDPVRHRDRADLPAHHRRLRAKRRGDA